MRNGCQWCGRRFVLEGKRWYCTHCDTAICPQHTSTLPPQSTTPPPDSEQGRLADGDPEALP